MATLTTEPIGTVLKDDNEPTSSGLSCIRKGAVSRPRRLVLYGVPAVGKSTFAAGSEKPIFIPTEDGIDDLDVDSFPLSRSLADFRNAVVTLRNESHDYQTVVVDSLDWLERLVQADVAAKAGVDSIGDIDFGKGYVRALDTFEKILAALNGLRDKGMSVVLIAHSDVVRVDPPDVECYDKYEPALHKKVTALVKEWCDELFFACYRIHVVSEKSKFGKESAKPVGGDRIMRTVEQPYCSAKCRLKGVPEVLPLSWPAYKEHWK